MLDTFHIDIGKEFSKILGPRFRRDGEFSGEDFRERFLEPNLSAHQKVVIHLDSLSGYTPSFFEEAFGGLVRKHGASVMSRIEFDAVDRGYLIPIITAWMHDASRSAVAM